MSKETVYPIQQMRSKIVASEIYEFFWHVYAHRVFLPSRSVPIRLNSPIRIRKVALSLYQCKKFYLNPKDSYSEKFDQAFENTSKFQAPVRINRRTFHLTWRLRALGRYGRGDGSAQEIPGNRCDTIAVGSSTIALAVITYPLIHFPRGCS